MSKLRRIMGKDAAFDFDESRYPGVNVTEIEIQVTEDAEGDYVNLSGLDGVASVKKGNSTLAPGQTKKLVSNRAEPITIHGPINGVRARLSRRSA